MAALSKKEFKRTLENKSQRMFGRSLNAVSKRQMYKVVSNAVRDLVMERWSYSRETVHRRPERELYYLSMEFLMGQSLGMNALYIEVEGLVQAVLEDLGMSLEEIGDQEPDAGLGNGGLGRLAACFLDSLATIGLPAHGYGVRYEYGLFRQRIVDGYQIELPDSWLEDGNPWEVSAPEEAVIVNFGGYVEQVRDKGRTVFRHEGQQRVKAVLYEVPVVGFKSPVVNSLRLWGARAVKHMDMDLFGQGKYMDAVEEKELAEVISKILYPEDNHPEGKALRLKQQYFFVSASIQNIMRIYKERDQDIRELAERIVIQINDTHPALAIPELMRILLDEEGLSWDEAWDITTNVFAYTNHTILEEALEKWPDGLFQELLPRLWDIVCEINERFCRMLWQRYPGDWDRIASMAIVADGQVKMAHLSIVGSFSVNGVAQLHADILKDIVFKNFYELYPEKFRGITNGITFRRWALKANPGLTELVSSRIGSEWINNPVDLERFAQFAKDPEVHASLQDIRRERKTALADAIEKHNGIRVSPDSIFDVQIKRLHEYKRQLLNVLHIMHLYNQILDNPQVDLYPRTFIFGAKAAPGYRTAKLIIKLIHDVGELINNDNRIGDKLKVVFLENYRVSLAELIIPATDVSEQISTAGKEASGTGNMKFMLNGALTVGTLDGANVEIEEEVGADNMFIFGLSSSRVNQYYREGTYNAQAVAARNPALQRVLTQLVDGFLDAEKPQMFGELYQGLLYGHHGGMADPYFVLEDFDSYCRAQQRVDALFRDRDSWWEKAVINIAKAGRFSSDRTIAQYNEEVWRLPRFASVD